MLENEEKETEISEQQSEETAPEQGDFLSEGQTIDVKKRKRKNIWGLVFTLVIFALVVWALLQFSNTLQSGNTKTFMELIEGMNGWYLVAAAGLTLFVWLCDTLKYTLLNKTFDCKIGFLGDAKLGLTGKYYECITPTGTGGQPMQILYLYKRGVSGGKSTSIIMMKYTVQMFAAILVGAIVMGVWGRNLVNVIPSVSADANGISLKVVYIAGWVGFGLNACAPVFMIFVIFCPQFLKWIINLGLVILHKMHILKRYEERRDRIYRGIDDFAVCSKFIFEHPIKFFELLALCLVEPICGLIIPYFVIMALCGGQVNEMPNLIFTVAALTTFSTFASSFIPTPGTSGAAETVFMAAFASIGGEAIFWVTLVWRFYLYYIYIVLGIGMNIYDLTRGLITKRREERRSVSIGNTDETFTEADKDGEEQ